MRRFIKADVLILLRCSQEIKERFNRCFKWEKNIKKDEGLGIDPFVLLWNKTPFFFYDPYTDSDIILLAMGEVNVAIGHNIKLDEYDIKLNDTLDISNDSLTY